MFLLPWVVGVRYEEVGSGLEGSGRGGAIPRVFIKEVVGIAAKAAAAARVSGGGIRRIHRRSTTDGGTENIPDFGTSLVAFWQGFGLDIGKYANYTVDKINGMDAVVSFIAFVCLIVCVLLFYYEFVVVAMVVVYN